MLQTRPVQEIIDDQSKFEADVKAKADEERRLVDEARAKRAALVKRLTSALVVVLVDKGYEPEDTENFEYQSYITNELIFKNTGTKPIRSFEGTLHFTDTLGNDIVKSDLTYEQPIGVNRSVNYDGRMKFNEYNDADVHLRDASLANVRLKWEPRVILFTDGTRIESPGADNESSN